MNFEWSLAISLCNYEISILSCNSIEHVDCSAASMWQNSLRDLRWLRFKTWQDKKWIELIAVGINKLHR